MAQRLPYRPTELPALSATVSALIARGGLVAIPTETYYGVGANPFDATALRRLAAVKGRPDGKPLLVLVGAREHVADLVAATSPAAELLMAQFWPGPLTVVLPARDTLPVELTAGTGTVGVRWTSCVPLAELLKTVGPLTGTSANRSGDPPCSTADEVDRVLGSELDAIVDAGATPGGPASTVVRVEGTQVQIVREGAVASVRLEQALREQGFRLKPS